MLNSNQNRSAHDSIRGYVYQIWQSVFSWIQLHDAEQLYLEAAEDIDKYSFTGVETTQVKDTKSSSITLRSKGVVEAINNYWELFLRNPGQKISFRYLTTSACTTEAEKPFGNEAGLTFWNGVNCDRSEDIETIKNFLIAEKDSAGTHKFSTQLRSFLSTASFSQIYNDLIKPIRWNCDEPELAKVKFYVENLLISHGDRIGVPPTECKAVAPCLCQVALEYAASAERKTLARRDFLEIFESKTSTLVPNSLIRDFLTKTQQSASGPISLLIPDFQSSVPDIMFPHFRRESIIKKLSDSISKANFLFLSGLSGSGKTTLAKLVAKQMNRGWLWVGLRGLRDEKTVLECLSQVVAFIYRSPSVENIIIDDLAWRTNLSYVHQKLEELAYLIVRERKGKLMVTSLDNLGPGLKVKLGLNDTSFYAVPSFSLAEVNDLLIFFGSEDHQRTKLHAKLILEKTRGHIQLVHAYAKYLKENKFDIPPSTVLTQQPSDVSDLKKFALQTVADLYDEATQNFIFKLTLLSGIFTKDQALRIAKHNPPVTNPGIIFDRITGAWIEPIGNQYFRISPLIEDTAHEIIDTHSIISLHCAIANAIFDSLTLSLNEFSTAFFHSWKAQDAEVLKRAAISALKEHNKIFWKNVSDYLFWFANVKLEEPFELFAANVRVNNLLRAVQYKIAAHYNHKNAVKICTLMDQETTLSFGDMEEEHVMSRIQFIYTVVALSEPVKFPTTYLLKLIFELKTIVEKYPKFEILNDLPIIPDAISEGMDSSKTDISSLFLMVIPRCGSFADLDAALDLIDKLSSSKRDFLFKRVGNSDFLNGHWISLTINNESKVEKPDWASGITIFEKWTKKTIDWNIPKFSQALVKGVTDIYVEFLKNFKKAYEACENAPMSLRDSFTVQNAKANILFEQQEYDGAVSIWRKILLPGHSSDDPFVVYSYRSAAIAESKLNQLKIAFTYLIKAYDLSKKIGHLNRPLGYKVDAAYCLWKVKDYQEFLNSMHEIVTELERVPNDSSDVSNYGLHKLIGHCLCWYVANINEQVVDLFEPVVGVCSNPNLNEGVLDLVQTPIEYSWLNLVLIERKVGTRNKVFLEQYKRLDTCPYPLIRRQIRVFQLEHFFHSQPERIIELCASARMESRLEEKVGSNLNIEVALTDFELSATDKDSITVNSLIFVSFFLLYERSFDQNKIISVVDELVKRNVSLQCTSLFEQLAELKKMVTLDALELMKILQNGNKTHYVRIFSAILVLNAADAGNEAVFYAQSIISRFLSDVKNAHVSIDPIANKVTHYWEKATKSPAFIKSPRTSIPAILNACNTSYNGLQKIASVLLAAYEAVNLVVDDGTIEGWKQITRN